MIPKIIHQIWIQGRDKVPDRLKKMMETCHYSGYQYYLWDDKMIMELLHHYGDKELIKIYQVQEHKAGQADIARYLILYYYGGFYIDADYVCQKKLDVFTSADLIYIPHNVMNIVKTINNGLLGAKQLHEVF
jgi:mannosyltransferase OCH1-like enzyme